MKLALFGIIITVHFRIQENIQKLEFLKFSELRFNLVLVWFKPLSNPALFFWNKSGLKIRIKAALAEIKRTKLAKLFKFQDYRNWNFNLAVFLLIILAISWMK